MAIQLTNIIKGLLYRLKSKRPQHRFKPISWLQEKKLKHEEDRTVKTIRIGEVRFRYKRPYELMHTYKELFEDEIYNFKSDKPSPFIIDCGANIGLSVIYFKRLYPSASVLAFEPDHDNFQILKENMIINGITDVECRESAVWTHNGDISFASEGSQGSQISLESVGKSIVQIKCERLADIIQNKKVDFLKIDIEGAELDVLQDCASYLNNVSNLFVEYHGKASDTEKLFKTIKVLKENYRVYIKLAADNIKYPFITKTVDGAFDVQLNIFCYT